MTTPPSQNGTPEDRFRRIAEVREDGLGKIYQAQDSRADEQTVSLLLLKQIITRLPPATRRRLKEAADEARKISIQTLLKVRDDNLNSGGEALFIVMDWVEGISLRQWMQPSRQTPEAIINLVATIAYAVDYPLKHRLKWVRPVIDLDKIYIQSDPTSTASDLPILVDLGFAALLYNNPTVTELPFDGPDEIRKLGILLLRLLHGDLGDWENDWSSSTVVDARMTELSRQQASLARSFWRVLARAFAVNPADQYADPSAFADALLPFTQTASPRTNPAPFSLPSILPTPTTALARVSPQTVAEVKPGAKYQLKIYDQKQKEYLQLVTLTGQPITAGRSPEDKVLLPRLSEQRLYFVYLNGKFGGRYTVTDTGNGSFGNHFARLDDVPLSPYYAALLPEKQLLTIADYSIELVSTQPSVAGRSPQQSPPLQVAVRAFVGQPGERILIPVVIQNQTKEVDSFWLVLDGVPNEWRKSMQPERELFEGEKAEMPITITLPTVQRSIAQVYSLTLRLLSRNLKAQIAATTIQIELLPAYDFLGGIDPESLRTGRAGEVYIENHGNFSRIFRLTWRDRAKELIFDPSETTLMVRAGEIGAVVFYAYPRQWRLLGREKLHQMSVLATPQGGGMAQTYSGQVLSRALIPGWVPALVLLLLVGFILLASLLLPPDFAQTTIAPNGTALAGTPFTLYWTPINSCFYSVYENGVVRQPFTWQSGPGIYPVSNAAPDTKVEVRLRNCLFMAEKSWPVTVATPAPTSIPPPKIITFTVATTREVSPTRHLLLHQIGDFCVDWQVEGTYKTLQLDPPLVELKQKKGEQCVPVAPLFSEEKVVNLKLLVAYGDDQRIEAAPIQLIVEQARCYVNTKEAIGLYEGPDRTFPVRGYLSYEKMLFPTARPFMPFEQGSGEQWVQVTLLDDPRPGWVLSAYLFCPVNIDVLPVVGSVPPTPMPTLTPTPTATATPTPTVTPPPAPQVSVAPDLINLGGCAKLTWNIQNVKEVYLNDEGIVGTGEREDCPTAPGRLTYTWRIVQLDGNITEIKRQLLVNPGSSTAPTPPSN